MEIVETAPRALLAFAGRLIKYRLDDVGDRLGIMLPLDARSFSASAAAAVSAHLSKWS
jgi:hypothetical protein